MTEHCKETLCFGDDHGDNECTFTCGLVKGHKGPHVEGGVQYGKAYTLTWFNKVEE